MLLFSALFCNAPFFFIHYIFNRPHGLSLSVSRLRRVVPESEEQTEELEGSFQKASAFTVGVNREYEER